MEGGGDLRNALLSVATERDALRRQIASMQEAQSMPLPTPIAMPSANSFGGSPSLLTGTGSSYLNGEEQRLRRKLQQAGEEKYEVSVR